MAVRNDLQGKERDAATLPPIIALVLAAFGLALVVASGGEPASPSIAPPCACVPTPAVASRHALSADRKAQRRLPRINGFGFPENASGAGYQWREPSDVPRAESHVEGPTSDPSIEVTRPSVPAAVSGTHDLRQDLAEMARRQLSPYRLD